VTDRTPEERRRAAEERAARRAARDNGEPPVETPESVWFDRGRQADEPEPVDPGPEPIDPSPEPIDPRPEPEFQPLQSPRRTVVADRQPMSRAARAQRVGRPGRPTLPPHSPKPRRWFRRIVAVLGLAFIGAALYLINATFQPFQDERKQEGGVAVQIPAGYNARTIGQLLESKGVVDDARFFELNATLTLRRGKLRTGNYVLRRHMTNGAAIEALMQGPKVRVVKTFDVTIPEGRSRRETAPLADRSGIEGSYLKASGSKLAVAQARKLGAPKGAKTEGFLFPATYELKVGATARDLVDKQLSAFRDNFGGINLKRARKRHLSGYDLVIIASMIERETACDNERPLISSVIYNRLRQGIPLGIDATIRYAENNWTRPLRKSELERDGPYNTRVRKGLPPTPIGNPGRESLKAAARPAKTDYIFYVAKPGASHAFSSTDAEFARAVAAYNRAREENGGKAPATTC
jgi:uncharacterized YceG family protein